jgi:hypothetical protein
MNKPRVVRILSGEALLTLYASVLAWRDVLILHQSGNSPQAKEDFTGCEDAAEDLSVSGGSTRIESVYCCSPGIIFLPGF